MACKYHYEVRELFGGGYWPVRTLAQALKIVGQVLRTGKAALISRSEVI